MEIVDCEKYLCQDFLFHAARYELVPLTISELLVKHRILYKVHELETSPSGLPDRRIGFPPRRSILGSILFLIYINDLPNCIEPTNSVLYAEATTYGLTRNISYGLTKLTESNISKLKS